MSSAIISFRDVTKTFRRRVAVEGVSFDLVEGRTLGIVGESGSGKSTCVRLAVGLERPSDGSVAFRGLPYPKSPRAMRSIRRRLGVVFQDPYDSLDPRMSIGETIAEPLRFQGVGDSAAKEKAEAALAAVGLGDAELNSYPREYSGGGRQRIAIARALVVDPEVLICDEPTASLDVSVQAQITNLLLKLQASRNLSMIFVTHDLDLIRRVASDIVVLFAGRVMEAGPTDALIQSPRHPYTVTLLSAIPGIHPGSRKIVGVSSRAGSSEDVELPSVDRNGHACVFAPRCYRAQPECRISRPDLTHWESGVSTACFFPEEHGSKGGFGNALDRG